MEVPAIQTGGGHRVQLLPHPNCNFCARPLPSAAEGSPCPRCKRESWTEEPYLERVFAATFYCNKVYPKNQWSHSIWDLKEGAPGYRRIAKAAALLCERLYVNEIREDRGTVDIVTSPPPGTPGKTHDQAALIAKSFSDRTGIPYEPTLRKSEDTPATPRHKMGPSAKKDVEDLGFEVVHDVGGSEVLLLDDTIVRGTTLNSGARALRDAGADSVIGCVLLRSLTKNELEAANLKMVDARNLLPAPTNPHRTPGD